MMALITSWGKVRWVEKRKKLWEEGGGEVKNELRRMEKIKIRRGHRRKSQASSRLGLLLTAISIVTSEDGKYNEKLLDGGQEARWRMLSANKANEKTSTTLKLGANEEVVTIFKKN